MEKGSCWDGKGRGQLDRVAGICKSTQQDGLAGMKWRGVRQESSVLLVVVQWNRLGKKRSCRFRPRFLLDCSVLWEAVLPNGRLCSILGEQSTLCFGSIQVVGRTWSCFSPDFDGVARSAMQLS